MIRNLRSRALAVLFSLMLCLGLLPVTALAADGIELYVGGQLITESGCYENQGGTWTKVDGTEPASGQFYYDADTVTLTLNGVEISHNENVSVGSGVYYHSSVIAFSRSADVSLNIVVSQGTSTITGTGGIRVMSEAGDASLSISGSGSLAVNVGGNIDSGITLIGSKDANLNIDGADVTASSNVYGVQLQAGEGYKIAATINDGNLTASGSTVGIYFMRLYNDGPSSLTVSGNAVVDTEGSTGGIINGSPDSFQVGADGESGGIVFNGKSGTVYGNVTLDESLIINEGETLTIPEGSTLNTNGTLTNEGTINVESGGKLEGTSGGSGTITMAPTITTTSLSNGTVDTAFSQTLEATGDAPLTWSSSDLPTWLTLDSNTGVISGTPTAEGISTFSVTATNNSGSHSRKFTLTIEKPAFVPVTSLKLNSESLTLRETGSDTLTVTVEPADATNKDVTWASSDNNIATVSEDGTVTAINAGTATITATAADGSGISASCNLTVTHGNMIQTPKKDATCTEEGNTEYWYCETCKKYFSDSEGKNEIAPESTVIPATSHSYENGKCTVCGAIDPNFTPEIIAGANGAWQKGTQDGLSFTSNAAFDDFIKVQVDGKDLDASNYTTKEGSTIVTLKASYLETLSVGKHTLAIVSDTGLAETEFTILAASNSDESLVQTGDNNMSLVALLSIIGAMSAVIGVVALRKSRL